jgi:hypothetical protein
MKLVRVATAILLCVVAGSSPTMPAHAASLTSPMAFGAFPGTAKATSVQSLESSVGRSFAYIRVYRSWDDTFPDANVNWMQSTGHSLFLSIKARLKDGTNVSWQSIADSQPGDALYDNMVRWATAIKAYEMPIFVAFNHEPDTAHSQGSGTASQFIAAWQKFVTVMRDQGVTNARFAWTVAVRSFSLSPTNARYAPNYYPGDAWVDDIAVDAYNMYCLRKDGSYSRPWTSLQGLLSPFVQFAQAHPGPNLVVAEWGSPEDPADPNRKAQWIADAEQLFKQPGYERFVAISYWNHASHNFAGCDFSVTSGQAALQAFRTMGSDPFYSGTVS